MRPRPTKDASEVVYGLRAGLAVFASRKGDIERVGFSRAVRADVEALTSWASRQRVTCKEMSDAELERACESSHHEGLVVLTKARTWTTPQELADRLTKNKSVAIALDRVRNPYNVGAVLRTAAFLGVDAALIGSSAPHPALSPQAARVAEGGAEHLALCRTTDLAETLSRLRKAGVRVIGADMSGAQRYATFAFVRPCVIVMGNEREGLGERVRAQCDAFVAIPGTGAVESLNVAVAAGMLMAEATRR